MRALEDDEIKIASKQHLKSDSFKGFNRASNVNI